MILFNEKDKMSDIASCWIYLGQPLVPANTAEFPYPSAFYGNIIPQPLPNGPYYLGYSNYAYPFGGFPLGR